MTPLGKRFHRPLCHCTGYNDNKELLALVSRFPRWVCARNLSVECGVRGYPVGARGSNRCTASHLREPQSHTATAIVCKPAVTSCLCHSAKSWQYCSFFFCPQRTLIDLIIFSGAKKRCRREIIKMDTRLYQTGKAYNSVMMSVKYITWLSHYKRIERHLHF